MNAARVISTWHWVAYAVVLFISWPALIHDSGWPASGERHGGDGFDPAQLISLGVGGVLIALAGRLMTKLWGSWSDYTVQVRERGTANESRADVFSERLSECLAECAGLRVANEYLRADVEQLTAEVEELRARLDSVGE